MTHQREAAAKDWTERPGGRNPQASSYCLRVSFGGLFCSQPDPRGRSAYSGVRGQAAASLLSELCEWEFVGIP